jgi:hypothetical protein
MAGARNKTPFDFRDVLAQGIPLVGGQAVNLWALFYQERVRELAALRPFTSYDIDVLLTGPDAAKVATRLGWTFTGKKLWEMSALEGILTTPDGRIIEVIGSVYGLRAEETRDHLKKVTVQGVTCTVLSPTALLKGKIACAAALAQHGEEPRQDFKHVQILLPCSHMYLMDMIGACEAGQVSERDVLAELGFVRDTLRNKHAQKCGVSGRMNETIPWKTLGSSRFDKLRRYAENRQKLAQ